MMSAARENDDEHVSGKPHADVDNQAGISHAIVRAEHGRTGERMRERKNDPRAGT